MRFCRLLVCLLLLSACAEHTTRVIETPQTRELKGWQKPYEVDGQRYQPLRDHRDFTQRGVASWYGKKFHGRKTSNGEIYNMYAMTAAHKTLPLGVTVRVTNRDNGRSTLVKINDRGPFVAGRIIDLSFAAARELGIVEQGTAPVEIIALGYAGQGDGKQGYAAPLDYDAGDFAVQVGAFALSANAKRLAQRLQGEYGRSEVHFSDRDGRPLYRVRVGEYTSLQRAEVAKESLRNNGFSGAFVVAFE